MKRILFSAAAIVALWSGSAIQSSKAQWVVVDPTNLVENIISALQNTQTVLNQVTQISHEVQSLAYQAQNLQNMPPSVASAESVGVPATSPSPERHTVSTPAQRVMARLRGE